MENGNGATDIDMVIDEGVDLNVSASEASKGGLKFEVVLSQPASTPPRSISPGPKSVVSVDKIKEKLEQASERRQSLKAEKLANLEERFKKIDEAAKKRAEEETNFINAAKESLEKIKAAAENRESIMSDLKGKLSNHNTNRIKEVRQNLETSVTEFEEKVKEDLEKKLEVAEQNREKAIQDKLESLKKHDEKVEQIRLKRTSSMGVELDKEGNEENQNNGVASLSESN